jgi:hypothetical protein
MTGRGPGRRFFVFLVALTACWLAQSSGTLQAQPGVKGPAHLRLYIDNDSWGYDWTDEHYTHGTKVEWGRVGLSAGLGRRVFPHTAPCRHADSMDACYLERATLALGQNIYTPGNLRRSDPIIGDRPYGGWLYLEARTAAVVPSASRFGLHAGRQVEVGASLGVVGPSSLSDTIQRWWHESVVDAVRPEGWSHQLSDRPAVMLMAEVRQRFVDIRSSRYRFFDAIGSGGTAVGNVVTQAHLGGMLRLGFNVGNDFGPAQIGPAPVVPLPDALTVPGTGEADSAAMRRVPRNDSPRERKRGSLFTLYGFVAAEGRGVLYNVFLDAEADRYQIRRHPWVSDLSWGGVIRWGTVTFDYRRVNRSREFDPGGKGHAYDAMSLTFSTRSR